MLVQNLQTSDPLILRQAFSQIITGEVIPSSSQGLPSTVGYRKLGPQVSLIWGEYAHFSGIWHTLGGVYASISTGENPFFFQGKKVGLLEDPLEVTLAYSHQRVNYSFTKPYHALVLYIDTNLFSEVYHAVRRKAFVQRQEPNLVSFSSLAEKQSLLDLLLPLSYQATHDDLDSAAGLEASATIVEQFIQSLNFDLPNRLDRTTCQSLGLKAQELLLSQPHQQLTLSELSQQLDAPLRSIQKGFQEIYGSAPIEYHRRFRLLKFREYLRASGPTNIGDAGKRFGFHHAGRLSTTYKKLFGVLPSQDSDFDAAEILQKSLGFPHLPGLDGQYQRKK
jgi:AraC-like DNA-binding protein